jgi:hypothetical protein
MANAKASPNLQALPTSPSPAQSLSSEAVFDALKMILIGAPLNDVLRSVALLIEAQAEGAVCSIFLLDEDGQQLRYAAAPNLSDEYRWRVYWASRRVMRRSRLPTAACLHL